MPRGDFSKPDPEGGLIGMESRARVELFYLFRRLIGG
jgi:hypothetical protein